MIYFKSPQTLIIVIIKLNNMKEIKLEEKKLILRVEDNSENFGIVITDPILLDPKIKDNKLKEKERYELCNSSNCYNGTQKGQFVLGLIFESLSEMFKIYIELKKYGYKKSKIFKEDDRQIDQINYNKNNVESWFYTNHTNIVTVQIKEVDLDKFKSDLLLIGQKLNYKFVWGDENLFDGDNETNNKKYIIIS